MIWKGKMKAVDINDEVIDISNSDRNNNKASRAFHRTACRRATAEYVSTSLHWHANMPTWVESKNDEINSLDGSDFEEADDPDVDHSDWSNSSQNIPSQSLCCLAHCLAHLSMPTVARRIYQRQTTFHHCLTCSTRGYVQQMTQLLLSTYEGCHPPRHHLTHHQLTTHLHMSLTGALVQMT